MHIHIVGIAGTMTSALAKKLKDQGNIVTGSDQVDIYPPISTILNKSKIPVNQMSISKKIDLSIIGSSYKAFSNTKNEYDLIKKENIPHISATNFVAQNIIKKNSILVAGTFGKTTITGLLTWIFNQANFKPSFMFGGEAINNIDSLDINSSDWSIVEADESINGLDTKAKFLYYPVKYLILTSAHWEHKDSYKTEKENLNAFKKLIQKIPPTGILLVNDSENNACKLAKFSQSKIITYNGSKSDYQLIKYQISQNQTILHIKAKQETIILKTTLIGIHNFQNIIAAAALSLELGIDLNTLQKAILSFKGIKRRLQLINKINNINFYDDFAQSASRAESTINSVRLHHPSSAIKVFFEPSASFLQNKVGIHEFSKTFNGANEVILGKINFNQNIDKNNRVTAQDYKQVIGSKLIYLPIYQDIINHYSKTLKPNDILIHMSSGGLKGIKTFKKIINNLKSKN